MLSLILLLAVIGVVVYLIEQLPMADPFKVAIRIVVILCVVVYLIQLFGMDIPLPHRLKG